MKVKVRIGGEETTVDTKGEVARQESVPSQEDVFIGLGANLGNREDTISRALELLQSHCEVHEVSSLRESKPVGHLDQPDFLNGVARVTTRLGPRRLLAFLKEIERDLGREPTIKNGPRTIDLDLLLFGDRVMIRRDLRVPHPQMHERRFVLEPLAEIAPEVIHPVLRRTAAQLFASLGPRSSGEIRLLLQDPELSDMARLE